METVNVKIDADSKTLVLLTGDAEKISYPKPINQSGTIEAPRKYVETYNAEPLKALVTFSKEKHCIVFKDNATSEYSNTITGSLIINPDLAEFNINEPSKTLSPKALASFLKMRRMFFADKDVNMDIVTKLNSLTAKITADIEKSQDTRGNSNNAAKVAITTNIPESFKLNIPLLKGAEPKKFTVSINIDTTDAGVSVSLESVEYEELMQECIDNLIDFEVKYFVEKGIACIEY